MTSVEELALTKNFDRRLVRDELMDIACKMSNQELNKMIDDYIEQIKTDGNNMNEFELELSKFSAMVFADIVLRRG